MAVREQIEQKRAELDTAYAGIEERLSALESQWAEFAKTVYSELKALRKERDITHRALGAIYNLLEAINVGDIILTKELESGFYDILPTRFEDSA